MNDYLDLLVDLHKNSSRQGPGSQATLEKALALLSIPQNKPLKILDIGCGTGAASIPLAKLLNANITAVDLLPEFTNVLMQNAIAAGVSEKISILNASMDKLPLQENEYDIIWSEGAIYNMGFEKGICEWAKFLKPKGQLVVSEITWLSDERPEEINTYWNANYPEINTFSLKAKQLELAGYSDVKTFALPKDCWLENYYQPIAVKLDSFLEKHGHSETANMIVESEKQEIGMYERFHDYFSYGMYIATLNK